MAKSAVIFDFDGTLAETMGLWRDLEWSLCRDCGLTDYDAVMKDLAPLSIDEVAAYFHERYGLGDSNQSVVERINVAMADAYEHRAAPKPGAVELVKAFWERGIPMAVVSSTPPQLLALGVQAIGVADMLVKAVSVDDVGHSKREPHAFLAASEALGVAPQDTWVVEDSVYAINTARKAGYRTLGVYDQDPAGTLSELQDAADVACLSLVAVNVDALLAGELG